MPYDIFGRYIISKKWQYPNCIGAIDGKHVVMQPPPNAGSYFYNYKQTHSVVLMAVAGPDYQCLYADVGTNGRISDGGVWNKCGLAGAIEDGSLSLPPPKLLPYGTEPLSHVLVGDDAFALKPYLMKPYPHNGVTILWGPHQNMILDFACLSGCVNVIAL